MAEPQPHRYGSITSGDTPRTGTNRRVGGIKPPKFRGKDGENVLSWLHKVENWFLMNRIAEDFKVPAVSSLVAGDADNFYYYLVRSSEQSSTVGTHTWPNTAKNTGPLKPRSTIWPSLIVCISFRYTSRTKSRFICKTSISGAKTWRWSTKLLVNGLQGEPLTSLTRAKTRRTRTSRNYSNSVIAGALQAHQKPKTRLRTSSMRWTCNKLRATTVKSWGLSCAIAHFQKNRKGRESAPISKQKRNPSIRQLTRLIRNKKQRTLSPNAIRPTRATASRCTNFPTTAPK